MVVTRTRSRGYSSAWVEGFVQDNCSGSPLSPQGGTTCYIYGDRRETISDVSRGRASSERNFIGDVSHTKYTGSHSGITGFSWDLSSSPCPNGSLRKRYYSFSGTFYPHLSFPNFDLPSGWSSSGSWCDRQLRSLAESVPSATSLPNFLLELGDVKNIPTQIGNILSLLGNSARRGSLGGLLKGAANAHLMSEFGIKTLIRDVQSLLYAHERAIKRLNWLRKNNQQRVTVRRRRSGDIPSPEGTYDAGVPGLTGLVTVKRGAFSAKVTEVVGAQAHISYSDLDSSLAEIRAIRSIYGFNKPFSVIWEAIPFSWVIDYFTRIGDVIDAHSTIEQFSGTTRLSYPWYSKKVEYNCTFTMNSSSFLENCSIKGKTAWSGSFSSYVRSSVVPSGYSPPFLSGSLSGSQITNLLALLTQKGL